MTIAEAARKAGCSVATYLRRIRQREQDDQYRRAVSDEHRVNRGTAGWNPRAGNRKRNKGV